MVLCSSLLKMCVQRLKLILLAVFVLELVICSPPRNVSLASSNHENFNIKFPLNTLPDQIIVCQISFGNLWSQTNLSSNKKLNIWTQSWYFPFLFHFSVEMKQIRNLKQKKARERWKIVKPITLQRNF